MTSFIQDTIDSGKLVYPALAYAQAAAELMQESTPLISMVSPNLQNLDVVLGGVGTPDGTAQGSTSIKWGEKVRRIARTTVNGAIAAGILELVVDDKVFEAGFLGQVNEEVFSVTAVAADGVTLTITRSTHTGAAAIMADGAEVLVLGKPHEEGAVAKTGGLVIQPGEVTNYLQNFHEVADVTGSARNFPQYYKETGVDELVRQTAEHLMVLKHQLEHTLIWGKAQARSNTAGTPGKFDGLYERIASVNYADMSTDVITYLDIQAAIREMKKYDARPNVLLCSHYQADYFNNLNLSHVIVEGSEKAAGIYGTAVPALRIGDLVIDIIGTDKMSTNACLLTTANIGVGPKDMARHFHLKPLGVKGDSDQVMVLGEYTSQIKLPRSHYWFKNVKAAD